MKKIGKIKIELLVIGILIVVFACGVSAWRCAIHGPWAASSSGSISCEEDKNGDGCYYCEGQHSPMGGWSNWFICDLPCDLSKPGDCDKWQSANAGCNSLFVYAPSNREYCKGGETPPANCPAPTSYPDAHCEWKYSVPDGYWYWKCADTFYYSNCQICSNEYTCNVKYNYGTQWSGEPYCDMNVFGCPAKSTFACCGADGKTCSDTILGDASPLQDDIVEFCCGEEENCNTPLAPWIEPSHKICISKETQAVYTNRKYTACNDKYNNDADEGTDCGDSECQNERCDKEGELCGVCIRSSEKYPEYVCCLKKDKDGKVIGHRIAKAGECKSFSDGVWEGGSDDYNKGSSDYNKYCYTGECANNEEPYQAPYVCCAYLENYEWTLNHLDSEKFSFYYRWSLRDSCENFYPLFYLEEDASKCGEYPWWADQSEKLYTIPVPSPLSSTDIYYQGYSELKMDLLDKHYPPPENKPPEGSKANSESEAVRVETPESDIKCEYSIGSEKITKIDEISGDLITETLYDDWMNPKKVAGGKCKGFLLNRNYDLYSELPALLNGNPFYEDDGRVFGEMCKGQNIKNKTCMLQNIDICPKSVQYVATIENYIDATTKFCEEGTNYYKEYEEWEPYGPNAYSGVVVETDEVQYAEGDGSPKKVKLTLNLAGDAYKPNIIGFVIDKWNALGQVREISFENAGVSRIIALLKNDNGDSVLLSDKEIEELLYEHIHGGFGDLKYHARGYNTIEIEISDELVAEVTEKLRVLEYRWSPFGTYWDDEEVYSKTSTVEIWKHMELDEYFKFLLGNLLLGRKNTFRYAIINAVADSIKEQKTETKETEWLEIKNNDGTPKMKEVKGKWVSAGVYKYKKEQFVNRGLWPKFGIITSICTSDPTWGSLRGTYVLAPAGGIEIDGDGYSLDFSTEPLSEITQQFDVGSITGDSSGSYNVLELDTSKLNEICKVDVLGSKDFSIPPNKDFSIFADNGNVLIKVPKTAFDRPAVMTVKKVRVSNCQYETPPPLEFDFGLKLESLSLGDRNVVLNYPDHYSHLWIGGELTIEEAAKEIHQYSKSV